MKLNDLLLVLGREENICVILWSTEKRKFLFAGKVKDFVEISTKSQNYRRCFDYTVLEISRNKECCCIDINLRERTEDETVVSV